MEEEILFKIYERVKLGETVAMAVITEEIGSSPRKSGSIMAVFNDHNILGTVGGGKIEYTIIQKALECIDKKENFHFEYQLNEKDLGMVCGGMVKGYIKVFYPKPRLIIAGAGHIGEKLYKIATALEFETVIVDERKDYANKERFPLAEIIINDITEELKNLHTTKNDYIVIVTHSHINDQKTLETVINKEAAYIGMIGSTRKVRHVMQELIKDGISEEKLRMVYAPIGLNIASQLPEEIALGILSEILLVKNNGSLNHKKNLKKVWD